MKTIAERIIAVRGANTQGTFAKSLGINANTLRAYEKGRASPGYEVLRDLCEKFSVSHAWILTGDGPMQQEAGNGPAPLAPACSDGCETDLVLIPRVAARLAAGSGSLETCGDVRGHYAFRSDWIHRKGNPNKMVLMDVTGDSMAPRIEDGDMVLVDQSNTHIVAYGLYAIGVDDAVFVKELRPRPKKLVLHSINPAHDDIIVDMAAEQPQDVRIIGRVIWVGRELA